jgi:hypothetical protein
MAERSIYARGGSGMTTGGLDSYLGPEGQDFSNLPESIEDPEKSIDVADTDCSAANSGEAVCEIAEAERQTRHVSPSGELALEVEKSEPVKI